MFGKKKTPGEAYKAADHKRQKLRDKRSKLDKNDPNFKKKDDKLIAKIHKQNVIMEVAKTELTHPANNNTTVKKTTTVNLSKNDNSKSIQFHGHYHAGSKKKK